jgi:hypothetical protein
MAYSRDQLKHRLYQAIPVGEPAEGKEFYLEHFLDSLKIPEGERESVRKQTARLLRSWAEPKAKIKITKVGKHNYYHWINAQLKDECLGAFRAMPDSQAVAFHLMENHFGTLLPPQYRHELKTAYEAARNKTTSKEYLKDIALWKERLVINTLGFPLRQQLLDDDAYAVVYDALGNKQVLEANYSSVHPELNKKIASDGSGHLIFSPQEIRLQGMRLYVLALVQNQSPEPFFKLLSLSKLSGIKTYEKFDFGYEYKNQKWFSCKLKLRVHTIAKSYFDNLLIGNEQQFEKESDKSWILTATVKLPQHFANDGPDIFYLCSFLAGFSHSVEVLSPSCIRNDMKKRADKMALAYKTSNEGGKELMENFMDKAEKINDPDIVFLG